jgi:hypothetical protein
MKIKSAVSGEIRYLYGMEGEYGWWLVVDR